MIPQFGLLSHISSLRLSSGYLAPVLTLSNNYAAHTSLSSFCSLVVDVSIWATSPLAVAVRHYSLFVCLFFPPGYVALWDSKTPYRPACERVSYCVKTSPSRLPPRDGSPSLTLLSLLLSFIFCLTSFKREWTAFLGAWCPLPAFRSCFVEVDQRPNDLLMNLWGRKLSPHPIPLPSWDHLSKSYVFPVIMYRYESWTIKKAEHWRIDAFKLWCWRRPLRVPWTARRSNQSILKEINPEYSLEGLMLKLKLQYFCHRMRRADSLKNNNNNNNNKNPDAGKDWEQKKGVGWQRMRWLDDITDSMDTLLFSHSIMSDTLKSHGLQPTKVPYLSLSPGVWLKLMSIELMMPSHPLSPASPPAFNLSQHQGLFQWISSSHQVAKVLEFHLQPQFFQWTLRTDLL